jgi:RNA polymerase sigma-70 factor (ECF subfamily)
MTVAKNLLTDYYRVEARSRQLPPRERDSHCDEGSEARHLVSEQFIATVLSVLSAQHQEVLQLCVLDGLSTAEVAVRLKVPTGTVRSRLHYGLCELRQRIERGELNVEL